MLSKSNEQYASLNLPPQVENGRVVTYIRALFSPPEPAQRTLTLQEEEQQSFEEGWSKKYESLLQEKLVYRLRC